MASRELAAARAVVTGASSGIGRELALVLSRCGVHLQLVARRADLLDSLARQCRGNGVEAGVCVGDVADPLFRKELIAAVEACWGAIDVLVNHAGTSSHGRVADSDEATLRQVMEVNFFAATELTRGLLPLLEKGRQPAVVNVGSILGHRGAPFNAEYCASKFALRGWSEALRAELVPRGIDVLLVSPGTTKTEFFSHLVAKRMELPWKAAAGIEPAAVAEQTVAALRRSRREIFPNWRGRALVIANRLAPGLVDRLMVRLGRRGGP